MELFEGDNFYFYLDLFNFIVVYHSSFELVYPYIGHLEDVLLTDPLELVFQSLFFCILPLLYCVIVLTPDNATYRRKKVKKALCSRIIYIYIYFFCICFYFPFSRHS